MPTRSTIENRTNTFIRFGLCIVLAGVLWFVAMLNRSYEWTIQRPLAVESPKGFAIASSVPPTLQAGIKARGWDLLQLLYESQASPVQVNPRASTTWLPVAPLFRDYLGPRYEVMHTNPASLPFTMLALKGKKLPLHATYQLVPKEQYAEFDHRLSPDSITVFGSWAALKNLKEVQVAATLPMGIAGKFEGNFPITFPEGTGLRSSTKKAHLWLETQPVTEIERELRVPTLCPDNQMVPIPARVVLKINVCAGHVKQAETYPFEIGYRCNGPSAALYLKNKPSFLQNTRIIPQTIDLVGLQPNPTP